MTIVGIYGAGGFGREVMAATEAMLAARNESATRLIFIDDGVNGVPVNGFECLSFAEFCALDDHDKSVAIAIANSRVRETLEDRCRDADVGLATIIGPNSMIGHAVDIGPGAIICHYASVTSNVTIGRGFHAYLYSYVAHDCVIGDYVTFAPGVKCNGNIVIENHAYIGAGAVLKPGQPGNPLRIGAGAIVGMGAVVTRSVAAGTTVVGNPAKPVPSSG
jgi:sugar O-acyltransferase (sialic acid O-acetyltransferase NeuD family)